MSRIMLDLDHAEFPVTDSLLPNRYGYRGS